MIDYDLYTKAFKDVARINKQDKTTAELRLCKVYEEMGELTQAVNKTLGRKVAKETKEEILDNILEELADTFQCLYSWWDTSVNKASEDLERTLDLTTVPVKHSKSAQEVVIDCYKAIADTEASSYGVTYSSMAKVFIELLKLAQCFKFEFDDINKMVLIKNKKWEAVVDARKEEGKPALWPFS